ncbi:MAG TPA: serine hydrolase domain-containing protein [Pyrinomonadaceae bacterium]|jgi:CubicO group peptidase (beta-lactamase class C family)|nr:serine hydrolase domain-containing protein [Pyrinomonadaceae bacterium]
MRRLLIIFCVTFQLLFLSSINRTAIAAARPVPVDYTELEKVIQEELKATGTPGAAISIVNGDRVVYAKGFGVSNIETGAPVTTDMLFRLGSTTKMFTGAALVTLAAQRKLKLDEPIGT